jgi:hypothetical protein
MNPLHVKLLAFLHRRMRININYLISIGIARHAWRLGEPIRWPKPR